MPDDEKLPEEYNDAITFLRPGQGGDTPIRNARPSVVRMLASAQLDLTMNLIAEGRITYAEGSSASMTAALNILALLHTQEESTALLAELLRSWVDVYAAFKGDRH